MNIRNMGEYSDTYLKVDVLLLCDVFENLRKFGLETYGLDPAHYCTISSYSFDACLKYTKVKMELFTDVDMYTFIEKGIRGGICMVVRRHAKANIPEMDGYNILQILCQLIYFDGELIVLFSSSR